MEELHSPLQGGRYTGGGVPSTTGGYLLGGGDSGRGEFLWNVFSQTMKDGLKRGNGVILIARQLLYPPPPPSAPPQELSSLEWELSHLEPHHVSVPGPPLRGMAATTGLEEAVRRLGGAGAPKPCRRSPTPGYRYALYTHTCHMYASCISVDMFLGRRQR